MDKAANLLSIDIERIPVEDASRKMQKEAIDEVVHARIAGGKRYFIVVANMMTTIFGSIDNVDDYVDCLERARAEFRIHVDGAFGGFYYPFAGGDLVLDFSDPRISSITLDAHKMLQAPYGTGIFLARKGLMRYTVTREASYVDGQDCTLIGSRSGANAIAVWMIFVSMLLEDPEASPSG